MGKRILGWFAGIIVFFLVVGVAMMPLEEDSVAEQPRQSALSAAVHEDAEPNESAASSGPAVSVSSPSASRPVQETEPTAGSEPVEVPVPETTPEAEQPDVEPDYILNISSNKFHDPSCHSVGLMNESNKKLFVGTREEAMEQGYVPCMNCNP